MNKSQETIEITYSEEGVSALQISGFRMRVRTKRHDHWTGYFEMAFLHDYFVDEKWGGWRWGWSGTPNILLTWMKVYIVNHRYLIFFINNLVYSIGQWRIQHRMKQRSPTTPPNKHSLETHCKQITIQLAIGLQRAGMVIPPHPLSSNNCWIRPS